MSAAMEMVKSILFPNRDQHAIPTLDGAYVPNSRLDELPALDVALDGPDDIAAGDDGSLYVSDGRKLLHLSGDGLARSSIVAEFEAPITALARLADGGFAVGVNGTGVLHLDPSGRVLATIDTLNGAPLRCVTAIAEDKARGGVYFTVGSTRHDAEDWVWDLMELNRAGLLAYWPLGSGAAEVLLEGLAYPGGVQVEDGGASLLFTQSWTHSLARYHLTGGRGGGVDVVIDNMPGYPARIAPAANGGHWLALFAMRTQLVELVLREPQFRREMMRSVDPELWIRPALRTTGSYLEPLQGGGIKKLGIRKPWAPPRSYGLAVRLDAECDPVDSMHSRVDGRNHGVMAAREIGGRLYLAAKGAGRLLVENLQIPEARHD
ncbi:MAG TPA: SMP-30/gluconolactonase/LRE family protein [Alphaproteobacteria bacterium]|nr:SMP-30/gluconolactonase/LRE family protein [Alphaproteobacteria bacterium]